MKVNLPISGRRVPVPDHANILSTTDLKGALTHVNPDFIAISGFTEQELLGNNHNMVRHPDMPPEAFADLWQTLKAGRSWMGVVKNRCKNGDHYWVNAFVTPVRHEGKVCEYQSVRTQPSAAQVTAAEQLYAELRAGRQPRRIRRPLLSVGGQMMLGVAMVWVLGLGLAAAFALLSLSSAALLAVLGAAASSLLLYGQLAPLRGLVEQARQVGDNPLNQALFSGRTDEIGQIDFALRMLEAETGAVIGRIGDAAHLLTGTIGQLATQVDESLQHNQHQQAETDQVATAINQMTASVQEVASSALSSAEAAARADHETVQGQQLLSHSSATTRRLAEEIQQASQVISQLEAQSSAIGGVLEVIRSIAEQTNLLALNAAIEAARAGEQGRGFAVVADEVRNLASRTQQSTTQIQQMINSLQAVTQQSVQVMQGSGEQAQQSVEHAAQATQALQDIGERVKQITQMSAQIASAVEQQSAVSEEINGTITRIRAVSDQNVQAGRQSQTAASEVARLAISLRALAEQFWRQRRG